MLDLKCLIKLLLEKGYIKRSKRMVKNDETIAIEYECKYKEIGDKIAEHIDKCQACGDLYNIAWETEIRNGYGTKIEYISILNKDKFINFIIEENKGEEKFSYSPGNFAELYTRLFYNLDEIFKYDDRLYFSWNNMTQRWYITNLKIKKEREAKEKEEYDECLDFLSKLP